MIYSPQDLLGTTESLLKYDEDERLSEASPQHLHNALGRAVMIAVGDNWAKSRARRAVKRKAYYLSAEYLVGRLVYNNLFNLGILDEIRRVFAERGIDLACLEEIEDAALGNGGLGRLAACYMDSAATCGVPLSGYGLRYRFGLFKQSFENGAQKESADDWEKHGDPWSFRREKHTVRVRFADQTVLAVPYDTPVIGYHTDNVATLRLWQCEAEQELDFDAFNSQDYERALTEKNRAEDITRVLYPNDSTVEGKRLRIKQQYFLSSASLQDILRTYKSSGNGDLQRLGEFIAVQLNDTHPAMSIPELIRLLMAEGVDFDRAFAITRSVFSYTNHTVMGEALERWDMDLLRSVVPEICDILLKIEERLQQEFPGANLHVVCDNQARMADLSVYMSRKVNGVAEIHSQILRDDLFRAWNEKYPGRIVNVTNGITPRRWLGLCNPELTELIRAEIGEGFLRDLDRIGYLREHVSDELAMLFNAVKLQKKSQLAAHIRAAEGVDIPEEFVFDVQVKRAHEYKRQLMNALCLADFYFEIKTGGLTDMPPTAFIFGAKAAPGYRRAKAVIRYINRLAELVNNDPDVNGKMRIVFVQNYNCSYAEKIIPAADISEQISPAGTEASGTGNMKLMLNGAVTIGTLDGANVEMYERLGDENMFLFGLKTPEVIALKASGYDPQRYAREDAELGAVLDRISRGFSDGKSYSDLVSGLLYRGDTYMLCADYRDYVNTHDRLYASISDPSELARLSIVNTAEAGIFAADRAIKEYAEGIWGIKL